MKITILYFICLLMLVSCREKEPPEESVELGPVFMLSGTIDGQPFNAKAGENDYYMSTSFSSDSLDVYEFNSQLKQRCSSCKRSLNVSLRNYTAGSGCDPDTAFQANTDHPFYSSGGAVTHAAGYRVYFKSEYETQGVVSHYWDFGDGTFSSQKNPMKEYEPGIYHVTYTATFSSGCSSSLSYPLNLSAHLAGRNNQGFGYTYLDSNRIMLFCNKSQDKIIWDLGQGQFSSQSQVILQLDGGVRLVSFKRITPEGDTIVQRKNIASENYLLCNANFTHFALPKADELMLSAVTVEWTDAGGTTYSSRKVKQDAASFRILSSSPYLRNEKGQKTRKLNVAFDCLLSNGSQTIEIKNMTGTIALAFP
jgi:hypothetical protein